jgi:hypothetical protein
VGIFRRGEVLSPPGVSSTARRYKIRITTRDGQVLYWHKRGRLHLVEEDVAQIFVANFKPAVFEVQPDGSFAPPSPGSTLPVAKVEMEEAEEA